MLLHRAASRGNELNVFDVEVLVLLVSPSPCSFSSRAVFRRLWRIAGTAGRHTYSSFPNQSGACQMVAYSALAVNLRTEAPFLVLYVCDFQQSEFVF